LKTRSHARAWAALILVGLLGSTSAACQGPCRTLAEQVCRCSTSPRAQQACEVRVDANARGRSVSEEEAERCEALLDSCTCAALQRGERQACGLSELPEDVLPTGDRRGAEVPEEDIEG
jgi:hypothetical protein